MPSKFVDGRDKPGHDVTGGTSSMQTNFSIKTFAPYPITVAIRFRRPSRAKHRFLVRD